MAQFPIVLPRGKILFLFTFHVIFICLSGLGHLEILFGSSRFTLVETQYNYNLFYSVFVEFGLCSAYNFELKFVIV